ncbi:hypothetical protein D9758_008682 [Tetrapyrgos nigripes]|uniref:TLC domain-containing protein n=1 Tax=Tetrapyrgos nigripes TaxID=182062 RepID=A0A8H5FYR5_9AGAR|nr:hypothetical protein D9758_008682 [Tetrapyrgos nigripes]
MVSQPAYLPFSLPSSTSPDDFSGSLLFYISFILLVSSFHLFAPFISANGDNNKTERKLSWIITSVASLVMTVQSIPFLYDYFMSGGSVKSVRAAPTLAVAANRFFQAYLLADLTTGSFHYRSQINLLTGWIHHIVYIGIVEYAIRQGWASLFSLCACMEFPTFILGLSILIPRTRSNVFFAVSFFLTRILLHAVLAICLYMPWNRPLPQFSEAAIGSMGPAIILTCVFPLHASWFYGCIKGFIRRAKQAKAAKAEGATAVPEKVTEVSSVPVPVPVSIPVPAKLVLLPLLPPVPVPLPILTLASHLLRRPYTHYSHYYTRYTHYRTRFRAFRAEFKEGVKRNTTNVRESWKEGTKKAKDYGKKAREGVREGVRGRSNSIGREMFYEAVGLGRRSASSSPTRAS